jgi:hypothetical protein
MQAVGRTAELAGRNLHLLMTLRAGQPQSEGNQKRTPTIPAGNGPPEEFGTHPLKMPAMGAAEGRRWDGHGVSHERFSDRTQTLFLLPSILIPQRERLNRSAPVSAIQT